MDFNIYIDQIYDYWFRGTLDYDRWFMSGNKYDNEIKEKFSTVLNEAEKGSIENWFTTKKGYIAYILLLDQFSRQIYRNSHKSFQNDKKAVEISKIYLTQYIDKLSAIELVFMLLPFEHSEDLKDQEYGIHILKTILKTQQDDSEVKILNHALIYMKGHYKVIEQFGRFPKRNHLIEGRVSTNEEIEYMKNTTHLPY